MSPWQRLAWWHEAGPRSIGLDEAPTLNYIDLDFELGGLE